MHIRERFSQLIPSGRFYARLFSIGNLKLLKLGPTFSLLRLATSFPLLIVTAQIESAWQQPLNIPDRFFSLMGKFPPSSLITKLGPTNVPDPEPRLQSFSLIVGDVVTHTPANTRSLGGG